jgi:hypothetical protein
MDKKAFIIIWNRWFFIIIGLFFLFSLGIGWWDTHDININFDYFSNLNLKEKTQDFFKEENNSTELLLAELEKNISNMNKEYYDLKCNETLERDDYEKCLDLYNQISSQFDYYEGIKNGSIVLKNEEVKEDPIVEKETKPLVEVKDIESKSLVEQHSNYLTGKKNVNLKYVLRGKEKQISFDVYRGLNDYLAGLDRSISYYYTPPTDRDFAMKKIDNAIQGKELIKLVELIKKETSNEDDQARIAISIVQQLDYDWSSFNSNNLQDRYPYEVLYDEKGVCGEKTKLTAFLLKELGYGVVLFNYDLESHEAIGIKCPSEYDFKNTGYCFVETTTPSIITDSSGNYVGVGELSSNPQKIVVSSGKSFDSVSEEYEDNSQYQKLVAKGDVLSQSDYRKWENIVEKYGFRFD